LRNNAIHEDGKASIQQSVDFLLNYAQDLDLIRSNIQNDKGKSPGQQDAHVGPASPCESTAIPVMRKCFWEKPIAGTTKVNVDASFILGNGQASIGIIARNDKGEIIFSAARSLVGCKSTEEAELNAIYDGLALSSSWIQKPVIIETDYATATNAINKPGKDLSACCFLINDIKGKVSSGNVLYVTSVKRECNRVAHSLAAYARTCNLVGFWLGSVPASSEPPFVEDCNHYGVK
jgi:ribonuclease HI